MLAVLARRENGIRCATKSLDLEVSEVMTLTFLRHQ